MGKEKFNASVATDVWWHKLTTRRKPRPKRHRRRWLREPIPIEHQHSAARRRAGLGNEERQRIIDQGRCQ